MPHWLVIDLEATTDEGGWPVTDMEIIEIGATLVDRKGRELDQFQRFVRPSRRPLLTPFCRELTHITQANIDAAQPLGEVWPAFERWLGQHHTRLEGWASWGDYDRRQFERVCKDAGVGYPFGISHLNIKTLFAIAHGLEHEIGLDMAYAQLGLTMEGTHHRGVDDAWNIAGLLCGLFAPLRKSNAT